MSEKTRLPEKTRPDPAFKEYTAEQARKAGLELRNVELPQLSSTDLVLAVPPNTDLAGTMFDFFAKINLVEFKSEGDEFGLRELAFNQARAWLMFAKDQELELAELMNVFVCAHYPQKVVEFLKQEATSYSANPPWLVRGRMSGIELAIVVCRLLPMEQRYYTWLMFAPARSKKWREFVKMLIINREKELISQIMKLRVKEFRLVEIDLKAQLEELSPEEQAERKKDWLDLLESELNVVEEFYPESIGEAISKRVVNLTPEQRLAGLEPEQRLAGLEPEQRERLLKILLEEKNKGS